MKHEAEGSKQPQFQAILDSIIDIGRDLDKVKETLNGAENTFHSHTEAIASGADGLRCEVVKVRKSVVVLRDVLNSKALVPVDN